MPLSAGRSVTRHELSLELGALSAAETWIHERSSGRAVPTPWSPASGGDRRGTLAEVTAPAGVAVVRRTLPAGTSVVHAEWTDAEAVADLMCPHPARCTSVSMEPEVGGALRFEIEEDGVAFAVRGRFLALEPPHLIQFTWSCSTWSEHRALPLDLVQRHEASTGRGVSA